MKVTIEALKSLKQESTARRADGRADCLTADMVTRAAFGQLADDARGHVADHLGGCSDCASEYRFARIQKQWADQTGQASIPTRLDSSPYRAATVPPSRHRLAELFVYGRFAVVACLLLVALATLSVWLIMAHKEHNRQIAILNKQLAEGKLELMTSNRSLDEARRQRDEAIHTRDQLLVATNIKTADEINDPQIGTPTFDIDTIRGGLGEAPLHIEIPKTANSVTLIVSLGERKQYYVYEVEVFDQRNDRVWLGKCKNPGNKLNLTFPRRYLASGRYLIKLYGLENDKKVPLAEYPLTLTYK